MQGFVNAISDSSYAHPVDTAAKIHAMKSMTDVYVYHFGYRGKNSHTTLDINNYPPKVSYIDFLKVLCTVCTPEIDACPRNMLLLKNPQFLPNFFETRSK